MSHFLSLIFPDKEIGQYDNFIQVSQNFETNSDEEHLDFPVE